MSYSLLHASTKLDPTHYSGPLDSLRGLCEVVTLLMVVFYICAEINQIKMWVIMVIKGYCANFIKTSHLTPYLSEWPHIGGKTPHRILGEGQSNENCLISCRERRSYFTEWMTLFDLFGLLLLLCIVPLRYMGHKAQWMVTSLAFLFNFLRIFKFSCVSR